MKFFSMSLCLLACFRIDSIKMYFSACCACMKIISDLVKRMVEMKGQWSFGDYETLSSVCMLYDIYAANTYFISWYFNKYSIYDWFVYDCWGCRPRHTHHQESCGSLQDGTTALLSERIHLLAGEADEQAIFLLVLGDKLHDLANGLSYRNALNCSFSAQLFCHRPGRW